MPRSTPQHDHLRAVEDLEGAGDRQDRRARGDHLERRACRCAAAASRNSTKSTPRRTTSPRRPCAIDTQAARCAASGSRAPIRLPTRVAGALRDAERQHERERGHVQRDRVRGERHRAELARRSARRPRTPRSRARSGTRPGSRAPAMRAKRRASRRVARPRHPRALVQRETRGSARPARRARSRARERGRDARAADARAPGSPRWPKISAQSSSALHDVRRDQDHPQRRAHDARGPGGTGAARCRPG